jgi:hypothetical protein
MQKVGTKPGTVTPWHTRLHIDAPYLLTMENLHNSSPLFTET